MDMIYAVMAVFVELPWLAAIPALAFLALYVWSKRRTAFAAAIMWGLYGLYEAGMYLRILCGGECNIRVDLLLIYPLLALLSAAALAYAAVRGIKALPTGSPR